MPSRTTLQENAARFAKWERMANIPLAPVSKEPSGYQGADLLGVHPETYRRLRKGMTPTRAQALAMSAVVEGLLPFDEWEL